VRGAISHLPGPPGWRGGEAASTRGSCPFPPAATALSNALPVRPQVGLTTLAAYLRLRSYLVSARDHGTRAIDAIRLALAGTAWLPVPRTVCPTHALAA